VRAPAFWTQAAGPVSAALRPLALLYGLSAEARFRLANPSRAPIPVICIGNFVAGGQGKTPTALTIAGMLRELGYRPAFLTRGYGGSERGPLLVDPGKHRSDEVGDEPLLLARTAPTILARKRAQGAALAAAASADILVMDDGLQNPTLAKDVSLGVVDAGYGIGNGLVIPAGPLRAPLEAQIARIDALVIVGDGTAARPIIDAGMRRSLPVFRARLAPTIEAGRLTGQRMVAYAGIGRPEKFFATVRSLGIEAVDTKAFPDHHIFSDAEAEDLLRLASALGAELITTEKDLARLRGRAGAAARLAAASTALPVELLIADREALSELFHQKLRRQELAPQFLD
jgi:tetraacyldisaccharide 4'-kinase